MFKIIGGDGRQYGPVTADQLRQWIREGRANGQTLIQPDGALDWKTLASFPEFAAGLGGPGLPPVIGQEDLRKSKLIAGLFGILLGGIGIHRFYLGYIGLGVAQIIVTIVTCGIGAIWGLIEGILILCGSSITTDAEGRSLKDQ
jgi:TM2 domain-containing membrane protein YozV